ncbi:zinc finger protein 595-like [Wyeomyia smithii]|uniref:zinc finger protein 595-like n=1 Tax=Wyeomyia smithii TaxID=174621 RepID=UPI002467B0AA|nr:zinc finger protein 595-like [Wyeomyia smithii]
MTLIEYDNNHLLEHFENVCRFCLSQDHCIEILNNGINQSLIGASDFIISKVDENDGLPNKICQRCFKCALDFAELEARCKETYEVLQQIIEQRTEYTTDKNFTARISRQNTFRDQDEIYTNESEIIECENVNLENFEVADDIEITSTKEGLEDKKLSVGYIKINQKNNKGKVCPICGKLVSQLSKHMPTHSAVKRYTCEYCSKSFTHDTTLRKHIRSVHLKIKRYHCEICSQSFTDRSSLRYHDVVKHKDAKNFICTICCKSYYTSTGLAQHNSLNHEQRRFKCAQCGKMFAMKYHLKEHENTHSDARPHVCALCEKSFKRVKNLNEHMLTHKRLKS